MCVCVIERVVQREHSGDGCDLSSSLCNIIRSLYMGIHIIYVSELCYVIIYEAHISNSISGIFHHNNNI